MSDLTGQNQRYKAAVFTVKGVHSTRFFDDLNEAQRWVNSEFATVSWEHAFMIRDLEDNGKIALKGDPHHLIGPTARGG